MSNENHKTNGQSFFDKVKEAKNIAICTGGDLNSLNAGVAMSLYLAENFQKKPFLVYAGDLEHIDPVYSEYTDIKATLSTKKLKIIIDYKDTDISSLQWEKENNEKLVMELGPVNRGFDVKNIKFETVGDDADLIITVGISDLTKLGDFYTRNKSDFEQSYVVNIDNNSANVKYGQINMVYPDADSIISLLMRKFADWKYTPTAIVTSILLYGLNKHRAENNQDVVVDMQKSTES